MNSYKCINILVSPNVSLVGLKELLGMRPVSLESFELVLYKKEHVNHNNYVFTLIKISTLTELFCLVDSISSD